MPSVADRGLAAPRGSRGHFGIQLDLHPELQVVGNAVLMPFGCGWVSVTGEEKRQRYLAGALVDAERREVVALLRQQKKRLAVYLEDEHVGELTDKMSARITQWVLDLERADLLPTVEARVIGTKRQFVVFLKLAKPWGVLDEGMGDGRSLD